MFSIATVMDGVKIGIGMFIVLPLLIFILILLFFAGYDVMMFFLVLFLIAYAIYFAIKKYKINHPKNKNLKELKEELKWLEETPFYISRDGAPSLLLILFIIFTGIIFGIIIILTYKYFKKRNLRKKIKELEN